MTNFDVRDVQHAFLGMGGMGQSMVANLSAKGKLSKPVLIWNRTHETAVATAAQIGSGVQTVEDLVEIVKRSDIIWSCLYDQKAAEQVWHLVIDMVDMRGKLVVECSTITPDGTTDLERRLAAAGAELVAMPVFGDPSVSQKGKLICVTAGRASAINMIRPFLVNVMGRAHIDLSDSSPSQAHQLKLCGNIFLLTSMQQLAEFYVLAEKSGVGLENGRKLVEALFPLPPHAVYSPRMLSGECFDTSKSVVDIPKAKTVAGYVSRLADQHGVRLASYDVAVNNLDVIGNRGDIMAIYGAVREQSGLPFSNLDDA